MTERVCVVCGTPLKGPQRKYCADELCKATGRRADWLIKTYALTLAEYDLIVKAQGGVCGVCKKPFKSGQTPHIDHEHGKHVRGVVHPYCNTRLIGRLRDWETAQGLADYLRDPPAVKALGGPRVAPGRPAKKRVYRRRRRTS
ncbi:endonuclease domain-containing protein [Actinoplanes sp. CA-054009]